MRRWISTASLVLALVTTTVLLASKRAELRIDVDNAAMKSRGTPQALAMQERVRQFGTDQTVLVLLESVWPNARAEDIDRAADPAASGAIADPATTAAERGAMAPTADTFATAADRMGVLALVRTLRGMPEVREVQQLPVAATAAAPRGQLLAVTLAPPVGDGGLAASAARVLGVVDSRTPAVYSVHVTGAPVVEAAIAQALSDEKSRILPLVTAALAGLLLLFYRHLGAVVAVLVPVGLGVVWTTGMYAWCGLRVDPIAGLLEPVVLTVGVAASLHLVEAWLRRRSGGIVATTGVAFDATMATPVRRELALPMILALLTTVAGFLVLATNRLPAVRSFALFAALGATLTAVLAFTSTPLLLSWLVRPRVASGAASAASLRAREVTAWLRLRARRITGIAVFLCALGIGAWPWLRIDTDPLHVLPPAHPVRSAADHVAARLGGADAFDLLLPAEDHVSLPGALAQARRLAGAHAVGGLLGVPQRSHEGAWLLRARLAPQVADRLAALDAVEAEARAEGAPHATATGSTVLVARDSAALIRGQLRSMGTMLAVLLAAMAAGFRSWRLGLLGLLPNVLPCAVLYGGMALLGCRLSVAAAMVGTVMLGLIVDQSIHLLHRYRGARVEGRSRAGAVARALAVTGRPIAITSTVLATGFGIGMLGTLETTRVFGALTAATILLALAATLLVTPAAILWRRRSELQRTGIASTIGAATMAPAGSERVPGERAPPAEEPAAGTGSWCTERT